MGLTSLNHMALTSLNHMALTSLNHMALTSRVRSTVDDRPRRRSSCATDKRYHPCWCSLKAYEKKDVQKMGSGVAEDHDIR